MRVLQFTVGPMENNTVLLVNDEKREAAVLDPSFNSEVAFEAAEREGLKITTIVNTHCHLDHVILNGWFISKTGAPLAIHKEEISILDSLAEQASWFGMETPELVEPSRLLFDGDTISIGTEEVTVLHTPGHTPGGICLLGDGFVVTGDTLFAGGIGRADLPGGDMKQLLASIHDRLLVLPEKTVAYCGHGAKTTIGDEKRTNPFL